MPEFEPDIQSDTAALSRQDLLTSLQWHGQEGLDDVWSEEPVAFLGQQLPSKQVEKSTAQHASPATNRTATGEAAAQTPGQSTTKPVSAASGTTPAKDAHEYKGPKVSSAEQMALYEEICAFEGCDLKETAINTVIADGDPNAKIMILGEAPGADEDRSGLPLVGVSGQLLDKMIGAIGLQRSQVLVSNMVFWRPPGNRKPNQTESEICLNFTKRHIEIVKPKVILLVGALSAQKLLGTNDGITRLRGKWFPYTLADGSEVTCLPFLHPAYLLRQPRYKRESWIDMIEVKKKLLELDLLPST